MALEPGAVDLTGRVAVVTGAAVGLGRAIAETFARFGADLALCDRDAANLGHAQQCVVAQGSRALAGELDVRDADAVAAFLGRVRDEFGRIDVLVNNAGGGFASAFLDVSPRGQQALVDENFTSVTHFVRAGVPLMPESGGSIVNLTSIEAHRAGPGYAIYSAMKAALANLTRSLALELGDRRIRVNCIAPDGIPTPGIGDFDSRPPLAVEGRPDDVAGAALYLASDLSRYVTGTTLHVDGGTWAAGAWRRGPEGGFEL
jgi:3-oxoacyl-[acyl-carrier protein] reductase